MCACRILTIFRIYYFDFHRNPHFNRHEFMSWNTHSTDADFVKLRHIPIIMHSCLFVQCSVSLIKIVANQSLQNLAIFVFKCHAAVLVRKLDSVEVIVGWSPGRSTLVTNLGKLFTHVSVTEQFSLVLAKGWWWWVASKVAMVCISHRLNGVPIYT